MDVEQTSRFTVTPSPKALSADEREQLLADPGFGRIFTDHMVTIRYTEGQGWHSHAIGGFDREQARSLLGVPDGYQVEIAIAIGKLASRDSLSEELQAREQPTQRNPLHSLIAEGQFNFQA